PKGPAVRAAAAVVVRGAAARGGHERSCPPRRQHLDPDRRRREHLLAKPLSRIPGRRSGGDPAAGRGAARRDHAVAQGGSPGRDFQRQGGTTLPDGAACQPRRRGPQRALCRAHPAAARHHQELNSDLQRCCRRTGHARHRHRLGFREDQSSEGGMSATRTVAVRTRLTELRGTGLLRTLGLLALLIITAGFWIFFSVFATGFTSDFNVFFLLRSAAIAVTIGFAQMVVLSIGDMNLSVGAIGGATGMFAGWLMQVLDVPPALAVLLAIALGTTLGFGNAALVVWTHLNSFIVTLATASLITGGMLILTRARPFSNLPDSFIGIAQTELGGVPVAPLVLIMLAVALGLVYRSTGLGREMLAIGANRKAARMSGLAVGRIVLVAHGLSGLLAALAGAMSVAANNTASPGIGSDWVLASFVAPAIGGT